MHGLPEQTLEQALNDLRLAVENGATHISWYQLTIEPNTVFFRTQPILPVDEVLEEIQEQGEAYLKPMALSIMKSLPGVKNYPQHIT